VKTLLAAIHIVIPGRRESLQQKRLADEYIFTLYPAGLYVEPGQKYFLQIIPRIPLRRPDILPHISPESQYHINNYGRTHRQQRSVNKILTDFAGSDSQPCANGCTNAKRIPFNKVFEFIHSPKLKKMYHPANQELFRPLIFVLSQQFYGQ
jgi:hypothetical protein